MELHFCDPGLDYSLDIITEFQQSDLSDWWKASRRLLGNRHYHILTLLVRI